MPRVNVPRLNVPGGLPPWLPRRIPRLHELDTRSFTLIIIGVALALLLTSALFLNLFQQQRSKARHNNLLLAAWNEQLDAAAPAALERQRLQEQLSVVQARFAEASGRLPGTDVEGAILERITEAAERSGVTLTALRQLGAPFQEGSLVGWQYEVGAEGDLNQLTEFTTRLEEEAFPAAYLMDPTLSANPDGSYVLVGELTVYGSTLSTNALAQTTPLTPEQLSAQLRSGAATALANGDYELALSQLLRLKALEPGAADVDGLLYDAYVAYGDQLLAEGRPDLAREQYESALALNPNGPEATRGLLEVAQLITPTPGGIVTGPNLTATATPEFIEEPTPPFGSTPELEPSPTEEEFVFDPPPTFAPPPTSTRSPVPNIPNPTQGLPPTVAVPPQPPTRTPTPRPPAPVQNVTNTPSRTAVTTGFTATPSVTGTPPTSTPSVTGTPPTLTPTLTPSVTGTPPTATPSVTGTPPTPTPGPSPTPRPGTPPSSTTGPPSGIAFGPLTPTYLPNCGTTQVKGTIRDLGNGAPINGAYVRVWWDSAEPDQFYSNPSGTVASLGPGGYDVSLWPGVRAGKWYVAVADPGSGMLLSDVQTVETDAGPCQPGQSGRQVVIQDFAKFGSGPGVAQATATPGPTATATASPGASPTSTRTATVTGTVSVTSTPTRTNTPTPSPTVTLTPTPIPVRFEKRLDPDVPIPDGTGAPVISKLVVDSDVVIRELSVRPNITHPDIGDLEIYLVHPNGTRLLVHAEDEDRGEEDIRVYIPVTGSQLASVQGKSVRGEWTLEVTDTLEGEEGTLLEWFLQVYP